MLFRGSYFAKKSTNANKCRDNQIWKKNYSIWTSFLKRFVSTNILFRTLFYCTLKHRIEFPSGKRLWKFVFNRASTLNINFSIWSQFAINSFPWTKLLFVNYSNSRNFSKIKSLISVPFRIVIFLSCWFFFGS